MNATIYTGTLHHRRYLIRDHEFSYPLHLYGLNIDDLGELDRQSRWFGYNRVRPVAVHDRDYLYPGDAPLRSKVEQALAEHGLADPVERITLVTAARQFHYVFNPVSFFYCYTADQRLLAVLAQVNNTFGETHLYLLRPEADEQHFSAVKEFHVSPFFPRQGQYAFTLSAPGGEIDLRIDYHLEGQHALSARFHGSGRQMNDRHLRRLLLLHPLRAVLTMPRILWQAARLYFQKKLSVHTKPEPCSPMTLRGAPPGWLERIGRFTVLRFFRQLDSGRLIMELPEGRREAFGDPAGKPAAEIRVHRDRFFTRAMLASDVGFGEAYEDGDWSSPDLVQLLCLLALREEVLNDRKVLSAFAGRLFNAVGHRLRPNTLKGSKQNIRRHYDLSNELYALLLDPTMSYSSGIFASHRDSLEAAQLNKIQTIIGLAELGPEDHVLEIGCGWGGFAVEAVRRTGCRLTGITLSREQYDWATARVREEGLQERIDIRMLDYRQVEGRFSRIISIEMLEAVGHRNLPAYFAALERLLASGGRVVLQVITMPDQKYKVYRDGADWIQKYIFPGGHLPSISALSSAMAKTSRLNIAVLEDIGVHYAATLAHWRSALHRHGEQIRALGFDEFFLRRWEYYFSYCEAGFRTRIIRNYQLVLTRMGETVWHAAGPDEERGQ